MDVQLWRSEDRDLEAELVALAVRRAPVPLAHSEPWRELSRALVGRRKHWRERLERAEQFGWHLVPWPHDDRLADRLGRRLILTPSPWLRTPSGCGLLSSHLGAAPDTQMRWFEALRELLSRRAPPIVAESTTCAPWVEQWCRCTGRSSTVVRVGRGNQNGVAWLQQALGWLTNHADSRHGCISPPLSDSAATAARVLPDAILLALSETCCVLKLRPHGRLAPLIRQHLHDGNSPRIQLAVGPGLVEGRLADELVELGAEVWREFPAEPTRRQVRIRTNPNLVETETHEFVTSGDYLVHCTRRRNGPWPDQTVEAFREELLCDRPGADHSELAALLRILAQQRVQGSAEGLRGGRSAVCFADLPLSELSARRVYRRHRRRWDFNPFGIAVRRDWLFAAGARPVIYGDDRDWAAIQEEHRYLFQVRSSQRGDDWRVEREWRLAGSLELRQVPRDAAFVFVPDTAAARFASYLSRWPVVICPT